MHIEQPYVTDMGLSSATRPAVSSRRLSHEVLLVLVSGRMWVRDLDDSPDRSGTTSFVADGEGTGIGIYGLTDVVEVLDESDPDLHEQSR